MIAVAVSSKANLRRADGRNGIFRLRQFLRFFMPNCRHFVNVFDEYDNPSPHYQLKVGSSSSLNLSSVPFSKCSSVVMFGVSKAMEDIVEG
ncbi:hypothetical protein OUZ56_020282 [Daphnia magna]|uniref:Uncharacterized protein n=1 Tax=Daphnia magna TaxID=35525 RepID=A0ABQ9ZET7_9CRUS|nr:hypothetical protein OUZ56_020282 [Daphnia magna]